MLAMVSPAGGAAAPELKVTAPTQVGEPLTFHLTAPSGYTWATIFYRTQGEDSFQTLALQPEEGGYGGALASKQLGGRVIQFYAAYREGEALNFLPEAAPAALESITLGETVVPPPNPTQHRFPFRFDASLEQLLYRSQEHPGDKAFRANGQLALGYEMQSGEHLLSLSTRLVYQDTPAPGQSRVSVAELQGRYAYKEHHLQMGDIVAQESEFSLGGASRRGTDYVYSDGRFYSHLFALNTQPHQGMTGLVWPEKDTELYGGALGYSWLEGRVKSKLVLLGGKDDPTTAMNPVYASFFHAREGSTAAFTVSGAFQENRLLLSGEYARTSLDPDLSDGIGKTVDQAWRVNGAWMDGGFSARTSAWEIGRDFGSIGLPMMAANRRGASGGFSLALDPAWSLNANLMSERSNPDPQPYESKARNDQRSLDARWTVAEGFTLKAGLSQGEQWAENHLNLYAPYSNSRREGVFTGFDWALGLQGAVMFQAQADRIQGTGALPSQAHGLTLTMGGSFTEPNRLRLSPSLSLVRSTDDLTGMETRMTTGFLSGDVTLVPRLLVLVVNGGYSRTELPLQPAFSNTNGDFALQYFLTPWLEQQFQRGQAVLALRYRVTRTPGAPESDRRATLTFNISY